jgi:hypothetical protein
MIKLVALCAALAASTPLAAQTWKWVDERGVVNYGEKPPANRPAQAIDTQPGGTIESGDLRQRQFEAEVRRREASQQAFPVYSPPPPPPAEPAVRGMRLETFARLNRGMTEGELLLRAGRPDNETVENFHRYIVKSYYYYPTSADPFLTVITLRGGRIVNLERTRQTF